jgi:phage gp45-like
MSSITERLYRRVMMAVAPVKITATDDSGPVHRAQVRGFPPETIDNMPVLQIYGLASHAMPGSDAMALFASGDRSNGVIVATGNQQYRLRGLAPGEVALYTDEGDKVVLSRGRIIEITSGTKVRIVCPRLEVTGDIIDHCDDQPHTVQNMREIYNAHTHGNVLNGGASTAPPNLPMVAANDD